MRALDGLVAVVAGGSRGAVRAGARRAGPARRAGERGVTRDTALQLRPHGVAVVSLWPSVVLTERILTFDAQESALDIDGTESPRFPGRAVVALATAPDPLERSGRAFTTPRPRCNPSSGRWSRPCGPHLAFDESVRAAYAGFTEKFVRTPFAMTHLGFAMSEAQLEECLGRIAAAPELAGRVHVTGVYRPGDPGSVDPRVIQAFLRTDVISTGMLFAGQQIELQVRLD